MSTAEGRDSVQGSQHRADGCVDCDPGLVGLPVIPAEGTSVVLSAAAFLVSQVVTKALQEVENEQQGAEHTVEEDWDVWSSEQEEDLEEEQEEQGYESEEEEDADEGAEHVEERVNINMKTDDEAQEAGGEEKKVEGVRHEEPEKGTEKKKNLDPENSSL
nr:PREDICTED: histone H3.v1-like [Equus przewalskii]